MDWLNYYHNYYFPTNNTIFGKLGEEQWWCCRRSSWFACCLCGTFGCASLELLGMWSRRVVLYVCVPFRMYRNGWVWYYAFKSIVLVVRSPSCWWDTVTYGIFCMCAAVVLCFCACCRIFSFLFSQLPGRQSGSLHATRFKKTGDPTTLDDSMWNEEITVTWYGDWTSNRKNASM